MIKLINVFAQGYIPEFKSIFEIRLKLELNFLMLLKNFIHSFI